jgi:hypothetical protein
MWLPEFVILPHTYGPGCDISLTGLYELAIGWLVVKVLLFADDISILVTGKKHAELKYKIMGTLSRHKLVCS